MRLPPQRSDDETAGPGLPLLRTWRALYWFVFGCFVCYVVLLAIFSRTFA